MLASIPIVFLFLFAAITHRMEQRKKREDQRGMRSSILTTLPLQRHQPVHSGIAFVRSLLKSVRVKANRFARSCPLTTSMLVGVSSIIGAFTLGFLATPEEPAKPHPAISATRGHQFFVQSCAHCHGDDARGSGEDGDGPDLFGLRIGNARIGAVIRTGIPEEMPSFTKKYNADDIADLTAYLRTLR